MFCTEKIWSVGVSGRKLSGETGTVQRLSLSPVVMGHALFVFSVDVNVGTCCVQTFATQFVYLYLLIAPTFRIQCVSLIGRFAFNAFLTWCIHGQGSVVGFK